MKVASPKTGAKEPISLDMILVCKKQESAVFNDLEEDLEGVLLRRIKQAENGNGKLSKTDCFNIRASLFLTVASRSMLSGEDFQRLVREGLQGAGIGPMKQEE